jgi:hypothetical protein
MWCVPQSPCISGVTDMARDHRREHWERLERIMQRFQAQGRWDESFTFMDLWPELSHAEVEAWLAGTWAPAA